MKPYRVLRGVVIDGRHRDFGDAVALDESTARFLMSIKAVEPDEPVPAQPAPAKAAAPKEK